MHAYTLAFIKRKDEILFLNRNKAPWMGAWNGVGGKIHDNETPLESIQREIKEETHIDVLPSNIQEKGILTWERFVAIGGGLYLFLIELDPNTIYPTPIKTDEGILDWKKIDWACDFNNEGIAKNIPYFLPTLLNDSSLYSFHCIFEDGLLKSVTKSKLHPKESL